MRFLIFAACLSLSVANPASAYAEAAPGLSNQADQSSLTSPVGMPARLEQIVLPGSELVVKPIDSEGPIVLRIVESYPHGSDFRYDIEYYGLDPGEWNLSDYLERKDGSSAESLPELTVTISSLLPPGQVEPNALETEDVQGLGGYLIALIAGGVLWVTGLFAILFAGRKKDEQDNSAAARQVTLADRLRPIVKQAIEGELPGERLAELEMMLVAFWRKRLNMEDNAAAEVIPQLRSHSAAGPLLRQLESWLHQPESDTEIDVAALLEPYRNLPPDALDDA
ncbi:MAG: hypothetical protein H8E37_08960 [Planctomycetes bacterium]|nr:hypothetical protein [Planctomycetota bacterium]